MTVAREDIKKQRKLLVKLGINYAFLHGHHCIQSTPNSQTGAFKIAFESKSV